MTNRRRWHLVAWGASSAARWISVAGFLLLSSCAEEVDTRGVPPIYRGTVSDAETGAPIVGAVVVIAWEECGVIRFDMCGGASFRTIRETVTDSSGGFSIDPLPETDWDPFNFLHRHWTVIYAVDYLPVETSARGKLPGLGDFFDREIREGLATARISLSRVKSDSDLQRAALCCFSTIQSGSPRLERAVEEQERRLRERTVQRRDREDRAR